ncbi:anoctamin-9-like isoform X2 [Leucoraja erinacea]|uniref:anoctamin-9-like isoform X2 n=1 Tax=Leucoraja erinaceus TaxID=7782 RepID=UPI002455571F|nr:anoctamin-9-like isoform X2 [Leucoraja erinacea]
MLSAEGLEPDPPARSRSNMRQSSRLRAAFKSRIKRGVASTFRKATRLNRIAQKMETITNRAPDNNSVNVQIIHLTDDEEDYIIPKYLVNVEFVLVTRKSDGNGRSELERRFYLHMLKERGFSIVKKEDDCNVFFGLQAPDTLFDKYIYLLDISERTCSTTGLDTVSKSTRIRIIHFILKRTFVPGIGGLHELLKHKIFHSAFPLHAEDIWKKEHIFQKNWANWHRLFTKQPINQIRLYFGERHALYYAWLGWYTKMLLPAALGGIGVVIYGLCYHNRVQESEEVCTANTTIMCPHCDRCSFWRLSDTCVYSKVTQIFDQKITILFAMFMGIWATTFLELWNRTRAKVVSDWDLFNWDEDEEELALGLIYCPDVPPQKYHYSFRRTGIVLFLSFVQIAVIICIALGIVVFRITLSYSLLTAQLNFKREVAEIVSLMIGAILHYITLLIMTKVNCIVAKKLCKLEMQRTDLTRENSYTAKMFTFQFFNLFASIIYIAFFLGRINGYPGNYVKIAMKWRLEECHPSGCITNLVLQMGVIMVLKQVVGTTTEYVYPYLKYKRNKYQTRFSNDNDNVDEVMRHWIKNYNLADVNSYSLFEEFLEMAIQYSFTTIFVAAFPLAPLLALLNNLLEIRLDARKMILHLKRPIPRKAKDIGIWFEILEVIGVLAVIGNGLVISFTSDFIPRQVYLYITGPCKHPHHIKTEYRDYRNEYTQELTVQFWQIAAARLAFLVLFENIAVCIKYLAAWFIPEVPVGIQNKNLRRTYEQLKEELKMIVPKSPMTSLANQLTV